MNIINPKMLCYGFPVVLLTTRNSDKTTNITPISSSWVLGNNVIIGISTESKAYENLITNKGLVLNIADSSLWSNVEAISQYTGKEDIILEDKYINPKLWDPLIYNFRSY